MKIKKTLYLLTFGLALMRVVGWAQTTPTGAATSTTYPTGAVVSDSMNSTKPSRSQRRALKRNRVNRNTTNQNSQRNAGSTAATSQEGQYRQSSAANGTAVNNSNSTNYNSNSATNNATGVGSNPSVATEPTTLGSSSSSGSSTSVSAADAATKTGTAAAVTGARTTATPAVVVGSTERNTSIHDFIASSPNYTTLQNALQSASLYDMLKENGPYTLFAPSNSAFKKLPATVQAGLLEGRNREALKQLLLHHVVEGSLDAAELTQRIKVGNGKAQLQTAAGSTLTAQVGPGGRVTITDEQGKTAVVEAPDKLQSNGVVHGIDTVLLLKNGANSIR